jgi:DNA-binding response OmpR family regulator
MSGAHAEAGDSVTQPSQPVSSPATGRRPAPSGDVRPTTRPVDVLLERVVVVAGDRADEVVAGLGAAGISARAVSAPSVATMIAGLAVLPPGPETSVAIEALATHRRRGAAVGGILLADAGPAECEAWLDAGADAVLPTSSSISLLAAQLRALARLLGTDPPGAEPEIITVRGITIDLERREVRAGGRTLGLTPTEFRILAMLARKRGVVSHGELFREIHGYDVSDQEAKDILKVHIWRLRAKLAAAVPDNNAIVNVRGFGYLLERRSGRERRTRTESGQDDLV